VFDVRWPAGRAREPDGVLSLPRTDEGVDRWDPLPASRPPRTSALPPGPRAPAPQRLRRRAGRRPLRRRGVVAGLHRDDHRGRQPPPLRPWRRGRRPRLAAAAVALGRRPPPARVW